MTVCCCLFAGLVVMGQAEDADLAARTVLYTDGAAQGYAVAPWSMQCEEPVADAPVGKYLWLNGDCKAQPWSGVRVVADGKDAGFIVTEDWLAKGFIRFDMTGGYDRYGNPGPAEIQLRPETEGLRYQLLRSSQIARGRGLDEDPESWQTVLVPLRYWTELRAGARITGLCLQSRGQINRPVGYDNLEFVCFREIPAWLAELGNEEVAQPDVTWPAYAKLPESLRATPRVVDGEFVGADGRRTFLIAPYCREDRRLDVWGTTDEERGKTIPDHGLFVPEKHGWIYDNLFTAESIRRLGFNVYSATMPPQPFWEALGYTGKRREQDPARLTASFQRIATPYYVDTVCWPYTLGAPGTDLKSTPLGKAALTEGRNHWVPYRITGEGREQWLRMWRLYAERYRDMKVPVVGFELMNEPAYLGRSQDHVAGFATWLEQRHGSLAALNAAWQTEFASWEEAADVSADEKVRDVAGRFFDYDDYLSALFNDLVRVGAEEVRSILPGVPVGVQTMGGYAGSPREAVFKHRFVQYETLVITPTGGGRWTSGGAATRQLADRLASPIAPAPLENDLLLAMADGKMIFDNETYLRGQTRREVRNRLWEHVICGLDGLTVFSWSRRGWAWWKDRAKVQTEADKYPYSNLNPIARRTDGLRGILEFSQEVLPLAPEILPKGWGPEPTVGLLYSWPQARRKVLDATTPGKTAAYYAAKVRSLQHASRALRPGLGSGWSGWAARAGSWRGPLHGARTGSRTPRVRGEGGRAGLRRGRPRVGHLRSAAARDAGGGYPWRAGRGPRDMRGGAVALRRSTGPAGRRCEGRSQGLERSPRAPSPLGGERHGLRADCRCGGVPLGGAVGCRLLGSRPDRQLVPQRPYRGAGADGRSGECACLATVLSGSARPPAAEPRWVRQDARCASSWRRRRLAGEGSAVRNGSGADCWRHPPRSRRRRPGRADLDKAVGTGGRLAGTGYIAPLPFPSLNPGVCIPCAMRPNEPRPPTSCGVCTARG
jgi:hypothetical protein